LITNPMHFECLPVTRAAQNCSVLWCSASRRAAVIDPGGDLYQIESFLESEELTLELVLVTHAHVDHAGGVAQLAASSGARLEGPHRGDEHLAQRMADQGRRLRMPAMLAGSSFRDTNACGQGQMHTHLLV
jgi:hydroxyacylglutathione hydrolase